jgi:bifunctional DNA-binding transcriptional regulator/antitoxin component of YhaV-PrlF toxin-antitoxin module
MVTSKGQTTLSRDVRAALKIYVGDTLRSVVSGGEVCILKVRSVAKVLGILSRANQVKASVEAMDEAIGNGVTS